MTTLFISDLHLHPQRPRLTRAFFDFLDAHAGQADALYILGDFFHLWLYDDELSQQIAARLKQFSLAGTQVFLMHGNRDFLFGKRYCRRAGAELIKDPTTIDLYGTRVLLMHGDSLCLEDASYQRYRRIIRSRALFAAQYVVPLRTKQKIARKIQRQSSQAKSEKSLQIMDVSADEIPRQLERHGVDIMIHGHTHRPAVHQFEHAGRSQQRIVLGDWGELGWYLAWHPDGSHELISFEIPA